MKNQKTINIAGSSGIALQGYDPVSCFSDSGPSHGNPAIRTRHQGAIYLFANVEHQRAFEAAPGDYIPQFGGYCAYGIALNTLFPVDMATAQVRDGLLYLNFNQDVLKLFNADAKQHIAKARENWKTLSQGTMEPASVC